jgi:hypothetical protein
MNIEQLERLYLIIGPISSITAIILNILAFIIFLKKEFTESKIYKYLSVNSLVDALFYLITILVPLSRCTVFCKWSVNEAYYLAIYEFYVAMCFGPVVKTFSTYMNIAIAFYRVVEISRFKNINRKCYVLIVCISLFMLAILTTLPLFLIKTIVRADDSKSNLIYIRKDVDFVLNSTILGYNLKKVIDTSRIVLNVICLTFIIIPNIYVFVYFKKQFKTRNMVKKLNRTQAEDLINKNINSSGNSKKKREDYDKINRQEMKLSALVILVSFMCILDLVFKVIAFHVTFQAEETSVKSKLGYLIAHLIAALSHSFNVLIYVLLNNNFRQYFVSILNLNVFQNKNDVTNNKINNFSIVLELMSMLFSYTIYSFLFKSKDTLLSRLIAVQSLCQYFFDTRY